MTEFPLVLLFLIGLLCLILPGSLRGVIKGMAAAGALLSLAGVFVGFVRPWSMSMTGFFAYTPYAHVIALGCAFFCFIVVCYSLKYADFIASLNRYYGFIFWCTGFSIAAVYAANLIILLTFWGLSGLMLYLLANMTPQGANAAKKSFIFIGGSDALMILGIALVGLIAGTFTIDKIHIPLGGASPLPVIAFLLLATAALTKAGAMPFHTWIPDFAENVPLSLTAFLPASMDKLLGIFLLVLLTSKLFILTSVLYFVLLLLGAITVVAAVYMAIIQHDMKKLLSYCAISQVGYMILGIGTGTALGVAGGVFHMINHAIYKSGLFLTAGSVEYRAGHTSLDRLGGLARYMPVTFICCVTFALSIAGVPPLSGFVSKWMIYQALIERIGTPGIAVGARLGYGIFVAAAMFGSALTLAIFMKLIHAVYLGQACLDEDEMKKRYREVPAVMTVPVVILAVLCIIFGVFAAPVALQYIVLPSLMTFGIQPALLPGLWQSGTATLLILAGLVLGLAVFLLMRTRIRYDRQFIGGEELPREERVTGRDFYNTVNEIGFFRVMYTLAKNKVFDIYDQGTRFVLAAGGRLSKLHNGSLTAYLFWFFVGSLLIYISLLQVH